MKRMFAILLVCALLLGPLCACREAGPGTGPSAAPEEPAAYSVAQAAQQASGWDGKELEYLAVEYGEESLADYLAGAYGLQDPWKDAAVIRATGASAFEIAVVRMEDDGAAVRAATAFMNYISTRQGDFAGYAPKEADMAANGEILQDGPYAALFICPNPKGASAAVEAALDGDFFPAPGSEAPGAQGKDVKALRDLLVSGQGMDGAELEKLDDGNRDALNAYMKDVYGISPDQWEECAIARDEESAFEVAVIRVSEDGDVGQDRVHAVTPAGDVERLLNLYLDTREAEFDRSTDQARLLHGALAVDASPYMVLLVCEDRKGAMNAFVAEAGIRGYGYSQRYRYLDADPDYPDRCLFTPPNEDDMSLYDTSAIRAAWEKDDPSGLSREDREIYDAAKKVLNKAVKDGMSGYEKEFAIYNWMVKNVNYDWTHQDRRKQTPRESFTPYGGLVNHTAVCLGYATTFQLLCDLAGVECMTVVGAAHESSSDHAWNMVRLKGEWYCVDATWDANAREQGGRGRPEDWDYFNVTSSDLADSDHQWDYANTPEAAAQDGGKG